MSRFRVITSSIFIGIIFLLMGLYREIAASELLDIIKVKEDKAIISIPRIKENKFFLNIEAIAIESAKGHAEM